MGKRLVPARLVISVTALLKAGCSLKQRVQVIPSDKQFPELQVHYLDVRFPNGYQHCFDFDADGRVPAVRCDYSEYGPNRPRLAPLLKQYDVKHFIA